MAVQPSQQEEEALVREFFSGATNGFFVEVGANHPIQRSQSYHLEQAGWTGVLIEPQPDLAAFLVTQRQAKVFAVACTSPGTAGNALPFHVAGPLSSLNADRMAPGAKADYVIMVRNQAKVFLAGPPLLKAATGEIATDEELGGAEMHAAVSGVAEWMAENDADGIRMAREVIAKWHWNDKLPPKPVRPFKGPLYVSQGTADEVWPVTRGRHVVSMRKSDLVTRSRFFQGAKHVLTKQADIVAQRNDITTLFHAQLDGGK